MPMRLARGVGSAAKSVGSMAVGAGKVGVRGAQTTISVLQTIYGAVQDIREYTEMVRGKIEVAEQTGEMVKAQIQEMPTILRGFIDSPQTLAQIDREMLKIEGGLLQQIDMYLEIFKSAEAGQREYMSVIRANVGLGTASDKAVSTRILADPDTLYSNYLKHNPTNENWRTLVVAPYGFGWSEDNERWESIRLFSAVEGALPIHGDPAYMLGLRDTQHTDYSESVLDIPIENLRGRWALHYSTSRHTNPELPQGRYVVGVFRDDSDWGTLRGDATFWQSYWASILSKMSSLVREAVTTDAKRHMVRHAENISTVFRDTLSMGEGPIGGLYQSVSQMASTGEDTAALFQGLLSNPQMAIDSYKENVNEFAHRWGGITGELHDLWHNDSTFRSQIRNIGETQRARWASGVFTLDRDQPFYRIAPPGYSMFPDLSQTDLRIVFQTRTEQGNLQFHWDKDLLLPIDDENMVNGEFRDESYLRAGGNRRARYFAVFPGPGVVWVHPFVRHVLHGRSFDILGYTQIKHDDIPTAYQSKLGADMNNFNAIRASQLARERQSVALATWTHRVRSAIDDGETTIGQVLQPIRDAQERIQDWLGDGGKLEGVVQDIRNLPEDLWSELSNQQEVQQMLAHLQSIRDRLTDLEFELPGEMLEFIQQLEGYIDGLIEKLENLPIDVIRTFRDWMIGDWSDHKFQGQLIGPPGEDDGLPGPGEGIMEIATAHAMGELSKFVGLSKMGAESLMDAMYMEGTPLYYVKKAITGDDQFRGIIPIMDTLDREISDIREMLYVTGAILDYDQWGMPTGLKDITRVTDRLSSMEDHVLELWDTLEGRMERINTTLTAFQSLGWDELPKDASPEEIRNLIKSGTPIGTMTEFADMLLELQTIIDVSEFAEQMQRGMQHMDQLPDIAGYLDNFDTFITSANAYFSDSMEVQQNLLHVMDRIHTSIGSIGDLAPTNPIRALIDWLKELFGVGKADEIFLPVEPTEPDPDPIHWFV